MIKVIPSFIKGYVTLFVLLWSLTAFSQITPNINSGNPNYPFPQFNSYTGAPVTLANANPIGVPHAEMEQRIRDAYTILTNNLTYNVNKGGTNAPVSVSGVQYIMPNPANVSLCTCAEEDGYYLLAAAYMADKTTFDGYYMWIHDRQFQKTQRFIDGVVNSPNYAYSPGISGAGSFGSSTNVLGGGVTGNSAADADEDIALALLVAWQQWGDNGTVGTAGTVNPNTGLPIYYKTEALNYIKTLVDTVAYAPGLPTINYVTGDIGLDGYHKSGDSWSEVTNWATAGAWQGLVPEQPGPQTNYVDYAASSYFRSFSDVLTTQGASSWCIEQYKRGEASDDWLIGQAYAQGDIPFAGQYSITDTTPTFTNVGAAEDFRFGWRTILNYVWNGAPTRTWDPVAHNYTIGTNTYEYDMALRFAGFLKNPQGPPYNNTGDITTYNTIQYCGTQGITWENNTKGTANIGGAGYELNWIMGAGSPAAVVSGDTDLMAQMFRECVIKWNQEGVVSPATVTASQQYLLSMPTYFHEWFRLLGMLVLTGNLHDPLDFASSGANMKVYKSVNKTYAHIGDTITYTINYRNYSKTPATNVVITNPLPSGLTFLSATGGGATNGGAVTWNIGSVQGFVTGGLAATMDSVQLQVIVGTSASGIVCNEATISCSNGTGWTSNEYPNYQTAVMQRNCVDILTDNPLIVTQTVSRPAVQVGDSVTYTIKVKNQPVPFLNGGRPGVTIAGANNGLNSSSFDLTLKYRIYNGAHEPLINYKNYRVSYYLNKPGTPAWVPTFSVNEGTDSIPTTSQETLSGGSTWNQRFLLTFPNQLATTISFLNDYDDAAQSIHQGATAPQRLIFNINDAAYDNYNWTTDWSSETTAQAADIAPYWPIANDCTDPLNPNQPVLKYTPFSCSNDVTTTIQKQLVEEWDGYTWRRIYGNAPVSGRDLYNVVAVDTLPSNVTFGGFVAGYPKGTVSSSGGYTIITWPAVTPMLVSDSVIYKYYVTLDSGAYFNCPNPSPSTITNSASASASNERSASGLATTNVSCSPVVTLSPSMSMTTNSPFYSVGDSITYTITYKNLSGTIVSDTTTQADWVNIAAIGATPLTVAAGSINLNSSYTPAGMYYSYSHGTNGTVKGTFTLANYQSVYAVILRYNGTTWTEVRFEVEGSSGVYVSVYNMPANIQVGTSQVIAYSNAPNVFDFQVQLVNGSLNIWAVNSGAMLSAQPAISFTGLTVQVGYAGVKSTAGSASTLTNWYTHLDSDFNLQVTDLIPTGISFVSADSTTYNSANYTVVNSSDTVKWKTIVGPILYGDSVVYTWVGKLTNCATGTITNIAYGNVLGITPVPATQDTISCTAGVTSVIPGAGTGNILLYPNPYINEAILKVSSPTNEKITVKIITTTGVEVYSSNDYSTNENISLGSNLPGGLYVLQVITSGQATTLRLVRNR